MGNMMVGEVRTSVLMGHYLPSGGGFEMGQRLAWSEVDQDTGMLEVREVEYCGSLSALVVLVLVRATMQYRFVHVATVRKV